jgi:hypothetical protein
MTNYHIIVREKWAALIITKYTFNLYVSYLNRAQVHVCTMWRARNNSCCSIIYSSIYQVITKEKGDDRYPNQGAAGKRQGKEEMQCIIGFGRLCATTRTAKLAKRVGERGRHAPHLKIHLLLTKSVG